MTKETIEITFKYHKGVSRKKMQKDIGMVMGIVIGSTEDMDPTFELVHSKEYIAFSVIFIAEHDEVLKVREKVSGKFPDMAIFKEWHE